MQKLSYKNQILVGVTLFSMFFGAGNLIFPPLLGYQAGQASLTAFIGFAISAIGLPILGVAAVARAGSLSALVGRVGKTFAGVFTVLIYLAIGPGLAIPRTASTSFEMAVTPFVNSTSWWARVGYSVAFFAVALAVALRPARLVEWLGKRLAPMLLVLIALLFLGAVFSGFSGAREPAVNYAAAPLAQGFLDGYQTMDAIAALVFGIVLTMNIRSRGVEEDKAVVSATVKAGWFAGGLFLIVYGALTWLGKTGGVAYGAGAENGAVLLTYVAERLFGVAGQVILAAIFVIACLNTCIGLLSCCGAYFHQLFPKLSFVMWTILFAVFSAIISNVGLNAILKLSVPVLGFLYPMAIVLILLAFLPQKIEEKHAMLYPLSVGITGVVSLLSTLLDNGVFVKVLGWLRALPLYDFGLVWLLPAAVGTVAGLLIVCKGNQKLAQ